jgi:cell wall-associated NlpC family hydrolase
MFGIELHNTLLTDCEAAGGSGYIVNAQGKPGFSKDYTYNTVSKLVIDLNSDLSVPDDTRQEMNTNNIAYTIIGKNKDYSKSFLPDRYFEKVAYENRIYIYGMLDCYTLIRDYFRNKHNIWIPANIDRSFNWWNNGKNLYVDLYHKYGFKQITSAIKRDDVLLFKFGNSMPSHSAIYIGNGMMLHHMLGRLSCVEPFDGIYKSSLIGVLRYDPVLE